MSFLFSHNAPDQNLVQRVFKHHYRGRTQRQIAAALQVNVGTISPWLANKDRYYPWVDHVVVDRALDGDPEAWEVATIYERLELYRVLSARLQREPYVEGVNRFVAGHTRNTVQHWTEQYTHCVGMPASQLRQRLRHVSTAKPKRYAA